MTASAKFPPVQIWLVGLVLLSSSSCPLRAQPRPGSARGIAESAAAHRAAEPDSNKLGAPDLGAQIWIEPGQTPAQIDGWFHTLAVAHMPVARLFLMWSDLEPAPGIWNFSLYDEAFRAAEREHVGIVATLTPSGPPVFLGGDGTQGRGVLGSLPAQAQAAVYIRTVVERYRLSPALDTWLILNEPGQGTQPEPLALQRLPAWLEQKYGSLAALNHAWGRDYKSFDEAEAPKGENSWNPIPGMDWSAYWRTYQTAQLAWLASQVRQSDTLHPLHLNPHSLVANLAENNDDLPSWNTFLDTLGCSIHPAWHFGLLNVERYTLGVSYINDLIAGAAGPKPHWVTELQGGNNISSGVVPLDPTADETTQWLWTSLGTGARRVLFWLLNARSRGVEAGEWSLLDYDGQPSDRLLAASRVASVIDAHKDFFAGSSAIRPPVSLIVSLDTMTLELHEARPDNAARGKNAQVIALLGFYEALSRLGVPPAVQHFDAYDWDGATSGRVAILPDVRALSAAQIVRLQHFAAHGNTLLLSGLSGFYDDDAGAWPVLRPGDTQPLAALTGASLQEVSVVAAGSPSMKVDGLAAALPADLWQSALTLVPGSGAHAIATDESRITATERQLPGGGRVLWLPQTIGTGAWQTDSAPLAAMLERELAASLEAQLFRLKGQPVGCLLRVLRNGTRDVTVVANTLPRRNVCSLETPPDMRAEALAGDAGDTMEPHATSVLLWSPAH